jgi:SAM-dependent methyltransferase
MPAPPHQPTDGLGAKPTERFTGRVESYRQFRPGYPASVLRLLERECGLTHGSSIVDVAAGTGLFTQLFLENGNTVTAVEPNQEMRAACRALEKDFPRLRVLDGTAEHTGLPDQCADLVTVAQAMHWFDLPRARTEFRRILRPEGWCVVAYNERRLSGDRFHDGYEAILRRFGIDYAAVQQRNLGSDALRAFFSPFPLHEQAFVNVQTLDRAGLVGRIVSSSYMPTPSHSLHREMLGAVERLFRENEKDGVVRLEYACVLRYGRLAKG